MVPGNGGGGGDAFADAVNATANLAAWWSPNAAAAGDLTDGAVAMPSMGTEDNPDLLCRVSSVGNWGIVAQNPGTTPSLTSAVQADEQNTSSSNFCGLDSGTALSADLNTALTGGTSNESSGFAIFQNSAANWNTANYQDVFTFQGDSDSSSTDSGNNQAMKVFFGDADNGQQAFTTPNALSPQSVAGIAAQRWYFYGWRQTSENNFTFYFVQIGDVWANVVETSGGNDHTWHGGLTLGLSTFNNARFQDGWWWGPLGVFKADIEEDGLQTIFEAIV